MENLFGQDIDRGDWVGTGFRVGNGTGLKVGRVLDVNGTAVKALVLWYDKVHPENGNTYQSNFDFNKLWKLDPQTLNWKIVRDLTIRFDKVDA